jgi:sugar-specific transcriptional regulator TrmB
MPENNDLLGRLVTGVMSERQAKVYLALLQRGRATSAELQRDSGISQTKIYETVRFLVSRGFCREQKIGNRRVYEAVDPVTALKSEESQLEERIREISSLASDLSGIYAAADKAATPIEYIEILNGTESIHRHYCDLVRGSTGELLGFGRPPYACNTNSKVKEQLRAYKRFIKGKGSSRWVFELDIPENKMAVAAVEPMQDLGIDIRVSTSLPLKMMVFDASTVLFAQEGSLMKPGELTMASIRNSAIANAFTALFEYFWQTSVPFEEWLNRKSP